MKYNLKNQWLFLCFLLLTFQGIGQTDTIPIIAQQLGRENLKTITDAFEGEKIVSASRTLKDVSELPFTVYVISKEEIRNNGYVTLVDALKYVPGVRVSQPGNGLEGELFLMRGLRGNSYCKILLNGTDLKPSVVNGMPLGAQLPIQQAERIEIIYGPAAAVHGADASAGVINIVMEKTERPSFTLASLTAGSNGFTDLNMFYGGKVGRNKNVLNFSFYASSTILDHQNIYYDTDELYNPYNYARTLPSGAVDTSYVELSNYDGEDAMEVEMTDLPHLSRMFGLDLRFRSFSFSLQRMYRRDHSAIGLNPKAVSYANPLHYMGETIANYKVGFERSRKKFGVNLQLNYLDFFMDNRSVVENVSNSMYDAMDLVVRSSAIGPNGNFNVQRYDSLSQLTYNFYFNRARYSYASSKDISFDQVYTYTPVSNFEITAGGKLQYSSGTPLVTLMRNPYEKDNIVGPMNFPIMPNFYGLYTFNAFSQLFLSFEKLKATLGIQYYYFQPVLEQIDLFGIKKWNPRIAALYKVNKAFSVRTFYGSAFRVPSPFYIVNTFEIEADNFNFLEIPIQFLLPENTETYELGFRWHPRKSFRADLTFFRSTTKNFIRYNFDNDITDLRDIDFTLGYFNNEESSAALWGTQASFIFNNIIPILKMDGKLNIQYAHGVEEDTADNEYDGVIEQPDLSLQLLLSARPLPKLSFSLLNVYHSSTIANRRSPERLDGFYTLDAVFRYNLSSKFQLQLKVNNFFNKEYPGLAADGSTDVLLYNPQQLRNWRFGISYRTN